MNHTANRRKALGRFKSLGQIFARPDIIWRSPYSNVGPLVLLQELLDFSTGGAATTEQDEIAGSLFDHPVCQV